MPRILTNKYGLPEPMVRALENNQYEPRGYISVTSLIDSAKPRILKSRFNYEEDVSDLVWSQFGTANHTILEMAAEQLEKYDLANGNQPRYLSEVKMEKIVEGIVLTGTADLPMLVTPHVLYDYKVSSYYKVADCKSYTCPLTGNKIYQATEKLFSWKGQGNVYKNLLECPKANRYKIDSVTGIRTDYPPIRIDYIRILVIMKDWSSTKAKMDKSYPRTPIAEVDIPLADTQAMNQYIASRVQYHKYMDSLQNVDDITPCSAFERWAKPTTVRLVPTGKERSLANMPFDTPDEIEKATAKYYEFLDQNISVKMDIVPGSSPRCENYCPVNKFCNFYLNSHGQH